MEIQYQNTKDDFLAFHNELWGDRKSRQRKDYYYSVSWYLAVLGLAIYIAIKHGEVFAVCVFVALGVFYLNQNWSFAKKWKAAAEEYAQMNLETSDTLRFDETGLTESYSGLTSHISWPIIRDYTISDERLFIRFLKHRGLIIPLRFLTASQRDEVIKILESHGIKKRDAVIAC